MAQRSPVDTAKAEVIAYNEKDWESVPSLLTPDCVYDEVGTQRRLTGLEDILAAWRGWATAFPDSQGSFDNVIASDRSVIMELTWRGTHTGPLRTPAGELAPTGRRIEIRACQIVNVEDVRVRAIRHYFDMTTLMQQLSGRP